MAGVLGISNSAYYQWAKKEASEGKKENILKNLR
jgi:hypothetical protein